MSRFKAVVFDWAGTMIDFGSCAPMGVFVAAFERFGVEATIEQARMPMGAPKRAHIEAMMRMPEIADQWQAIFGAAPTSADVDKVYDVFVPMNEEVVADYADLVPGALQAVEELRSMGLKIGSTTGYTRSIMDRVLPIAAEQGYTPDNLVCADDLPEGRPGPLGMYKCFVDLAVHPPESVIKVDDTAPGIGEGISAGCLTVGVTMSGNAVGLSPEALAARDAEETDRLRSHATRILTDAGAHHVIDTVADLPALVRCLEHQPSSGQASG